MRSTSRESCAISATTVVGVAASQGEAVAMARAKRPGLVLADIHLGEGGSGLSAVNEILKSIDVPVIFVTAYPERLLTGERPEPTYLVTKPFEPDTLKATIFQALSLAPPAAAGGAGDLIPPAPASYRDASVARSVIVGGPRARWRRRAGSIRCAIG